MSSVGGSAPSREELQRRLVVLQTIATVEGAFGNLAPGSLGLPPGSYTFDALSRRARELIGEVQNALYPTSRRDAEMRDIAEDVATLQTRASQFFPQEDVTPTRACGQGVRALRDVIHGGYCDTCRKIRRIPRTNRAMALVRELAALCTEVFNTSRHVREAVGEIMVTRENPAYHDLLSRIGLSSVPEIGQMFGVLLAYDPTSREVKQLWAGSGRTNIARGGQRTWCPDVQGATCLSAGHAGGYRWDGFSMSRSPTFAQCAAPKLLQYALQNDWVPMEMAEIWIAKPDVNLHDTFTHGTIYESCDTCKSFLGFMVCGLDVLWTRHHLEPGTRP
jgi:hypothetical protein